MTNILLTLIACSDKVLSYPIEKNEDDIDVYDDSIVEIEDSGLTEEEEIDIDDTIIEDSGDLNEYEDTGDSSDTGEILDEQEIDHDNDGFTESNGDCDDYNNTINPNSEEIPDNGIDEDCNGEDLETSPLDIDDDGDGFTENEGDCNDSNDSINPSSPDDTEDSLDNDCDGLIDEDYIPAIVDLYQYGGDFTAVGAPHADEIYYAADYGYSKIDSASGGNSYFVCGLLNGFVDCFCEQGYGSGNHCNAITVDNYIPFQQFTDLSITTSQICTLDSNGSALCWNSNGTIYNVPSTNTPYIDIVSLTNNKVCVLNELGNVYCFDTITNGLLYSDSNQYKVIDGGGIESLTAVLSSGYGIQYIELITGYTYSLNSQYEILGMGAGRYGYCYGFIDGNGMQTIECFETHSSVGGNNGFQSCFLNAPHEYYYPFVSNNLSLFNIEVSDDKWAAFYDANHNQTIRWGGAYLAYTSNPTYSVVSSGEWTGFGCNYYWGN